MGRTLKNLKAIPIPPDAYTNSHDGTVFIKIKDETDGRMHTRQVGRLATEDSMYPNEFFRDVYPNAWEEHYGKEGLLPYELDAGTYAAVLGAARSTGIYGILQEAYGGEAANAIMDFAMYSIVFRQDIARDFAPFMEEKVVFSDKVHSDAWFSGFFEGLDEKRHEKMRRDWLRKCVADGLGDVWISIDGSNNDCEASGAGLSEPGCSKRHSGKDIVAFMAAVNAANGTPVYYDAYEGSIVDCKAVHKLLSVLEAEGCKARGVIMDRGFCAEEAVSSLEDCGLEYIIMMNSAHNGHKEMCSRYAEEIFWSPRHFMDESGVFGVTDCVQLFKSRQRKGCVSLYMDGRRNCRETIRRLAEIDAEKERLRRLVSEGKEARVSPKAEKYIEIREENGERHVWSNYGEMKRILSSGGYFSILSSQRLGCRETFRIYRLREASEAQYSILKSQEGCDSMRVTSDKRIRSKLMAAFVASVARNEIMLACREKGMDTNEFLMKLKRLRLVRVGGGRYVYSKRHTNAQLDVLGRLGVTAESLGAIGDDVNKRMNTEYIGQDRTMPAGQANPAKKGRRGRPPGSRNKKTLAREAEVERMKAYGLYTEPERRKPGRPKGTKDSCQRTRRTKAEISNETR